MKIELQKVLKYFNCFEYSPSCEEIYTFYPRKVSQKRLKEYIDKTYRHTLGEYGIDSKVKRQKSKVSLNKLRKVKNYLDIIASFPQIRLIGLSGSVAMLNAKENDDVDLFMVSAKNRLWTTRFIVNIAALLYGLKRGRYEKQAKDKICLNLFFSEDHLRIEKKLRTEYMAHEVLQMRPILDVNQTYRKFLRENDWILSFFPNVRLSRYLPSNSSTIRYVSKNRVHSSSVLFGNILEMILRKAQLLYMAHPKGEERIEIGQLWFHPRDYSRIVKSKV
ncbi:MAG: hypothetical protein WBC38_00185 [Microgenomates group bacterium]